MEHLALDNGMGAIKLWGQGGGLQLESRVSISSGQALARMVGLGARKPPLQVTTSAGAFYVGGDAHDWGRPVEGLDYERLIGAPEMIALFYGALTAYMRQYGPFESELTITVGMPLEPLTGDPVTIAANVNAVKGWLRGVHTWRANGDDYSATVSNVRVTSQPVGALFDYAIGDDGRVNRGALRREVGVLSVGFNTVELMTVKNKAPVHKFTGGQTSGVRRLLELVNQQRLYTMGELDAQLRSGQLDVSAALPIWAREVDGVIESQWGRAWRRFAAIVTVGGGAVLLHDHLLRKFNGKAHVPDQPVLSIARGLYKQATMGK